MRASDSEREQTAERLRHAAGEGRLTVEELDERLDQAYRATTQAELAVLADDLPAPGVLPDNVRVVPGDEGTGRLIAIMGGVDRKGHWRLGRRCSVTCIMGGADLDLNDAEFASAEAELRVLCIMGGCDIRVPDGLNVQVSTVPIMGGVEVKLGETTPTPGGPVLRIRIVAIMGGGSIKRGRKLSQKGRHRVHGGPPPRP